jgi:hypothetical protein
MNQNERKLVCDWALQVSAILEIIDKVIAEQEDRNAAIIPRLQAVRDAMNLVDRDLLVLVGDELCSSPSPVSFLD